ncbi:restriction endonuclease subunit S [Acinetobacter haemolyticus]|uniref:restriction endonuclease subunit S n=1 Tax=Acinetobacter haemolyticus TaxID=29430 RepID=UPI00137296BB|nr:restriction endonuclease subunit S [Acinetobacter haemolyticus]NAR99202.1 restriction endonuclease subunit S [Acinetobacter haemolyticus]
MNNTDFMQKLLNGAQVEWKAVSEIFHLKNGYTPSTSKKEFWENGSVPWFRMDDIRENGQILGDSLQKISETAVKGGKLFPANSIIISTSATIGEHALITVPYLANQRFTNLSLKDSYVKVFDMKFIFYYCFLLAEWCKKNTTMSSFASVDMDGFRKFQIPIPCPDNPKKSLEIQAEIVRILDAFTAMTAELTAELKLRNQQYQYFRDKLLTFDMGEAQSSSDEIGRDRTRSDEIGRRIEVEWKTLGNIGEFTYGYAAKAQDSGDARFVRITDINANGKLIQEEPKYVNISDENEKYFLKKNDLLMARTGATFGKTMIFEEEYPAIYAGFLIKLSFDEKIVNPKYYWHFAQSDLFWDQANKLVSGGGQPQFNANALKQVKLPIPHPDDANKSLAEQQRIVSILDNFDALANSLTEGLPREIELRHKQYEYYRDLLLSFPQSSA